MDNQRVKNVDIVSGGYEIVHIGGTSFYTERELSLLGGENAERGLAMLLAGLEKSPQRDFIASQLRPFDSLFQDLTDLNLQRGANKEIKG